MAVSTIDPVTRIEGHLRIEMEVNDGVVTDAWASAGLFRGMELILENRDSQDASIIAQRICGVCPVSHSHAATIACENAFGINPPEGGRMLRNITEMAQFMHSDILWFYNLNGLDYCNPIDAVNADIADTFDVCMEHGLATADFANLQKRLAAFAENGQLSIFSGNWFDSTIGGEAAFKLTPELNLVVTAHYIEALEMQAKSSEISAIIGGKMPHIMTSIPGGSMFYPTSEKLDEIYFRVKDIKTWVNNVVLPDAIALSKVYASEYEYGKAYGNYVAWGVFDDPTFELNNRYMPAGVLTETDGDLVLTDVDARAITEDIARAYYKPSEPVNPLEGITDPWYPGSGYDRDDKYSWCKAPRYNGLPYEAGPLSRILVAYKRGVKSVVDLVDTVLKAVGQEGNIGYLQSTFGRAAARAVEMVYIMDCMEQECLDLIAYVGAGYNEYYTKPTNTTGTGEALWEAPRGALYHMAKLTNDKIDKYQIIIPSTWNLSPRDSEGVRGPVEQALVGVTVDDVEKPIAALRVVHSFDPCTACCVHVFEPKTGKSFTSVESPWGVR
jgi:hydrogenase large subunit